MKRNFKQPATLTCHRGPQLLYAWAATGCTVCRNRLCAAGFGSVMFALTAWAMLSLGAAPAFAQKGVSQNVAAVMADQGNSTLDEQRGALDRFLDAHPEIESEVLGNPAVISDPKYIQDHPALQAFLDSHPLVKADPRAFISPGAWRYESHRSDTDELLSYFIPFAIFVCCLLAVLWVVRTILENRRWNKSFRVHEEVHTKLIEKFASGQDFNAYLESTAGRRLLDWTSPAYDAPSRSLPVAAGRIIWSLQAGLVLLFVGVGLLLLRTHMTATEAPPLLVFGTLGVTIGAGFILSALVSYVLSKHLGLLSGMAPGSTGLSNR